MNVCCNSYGSFPVVYNSTSHWTVCSFWKMAVNQNVKTKKIYNSASFCLVLTHSDAFTSPISFPSTSHNSVEFNSFNAHFYCKMGILLVNPTSQITTDFTVHTTQHLLSLDPRPGWLNNCQRTVYTLKCTIYYIFDYTDCVFAFWRAVAFCGCEVCTDTVNIDKEVTFSCKRVHNSCIGLIVEALAWTVDTLGPWAPVSLVVWLHLPFTFFLHLLLRHLHKLHTYLQPSRQGCCLVRYQTDSPHFSCFPLCFICNICVNVVTSKKSG